MSSRKCPAPSLVGMRFSAYSRSPHLPSLFGMHMAPPGSDPLAPKIAWTMTHDDVFRAFCDDGARQSFQDRLIRRCKSETNGIPHHGRRAGADRPAHACCPLAWRAVPLRSLLLAPHTGQHSDRWSKEYRIFEASGLLAAMPRSAPNIRLRAASNGFRRRHISPARYDRCADAT